MSRGALDLSVMHESGQDPRQHLAPYLEALIAFALDLPTLI
jgi:hypothetical protein